MFNRSPFSPSLFPLHLSALCVFSLLALGCGHPVRAKPAPVALSAAQAASPTAQGVKENGKDTISSGSLESVSPQPGGNAPKGTRTPKPTLVLISDANQGRLSATPTEAPRPSSGIDPAILPQPLPVSPSPSSDDKVSSPAAPSPKDIQAALFSPPGKEAGKGKGAAASPDEGKKETGLPESSSLVLLDTFPYHYANARKFAEVGEYARASDEYQKAIKLQPGSMECLLDYGECLEKMNKNDQALAAYQTAVERHPEEPRPYLRIGNLFLKGKSEADWAKAREAYGKALAIRPDYKYALYNLGVLEKTAGRAGEAISLFKKVLAVDEYYALAHLNLGLLMQTAKETREEALQHFKRYLELGGKETEKVQNQINNLTKTPAIQ
jgi:Tfp pilus assembly protein PilF